MDSSIYTYLTEAFRELEVFSIPELGTFRKEYREASFDELNHQFLPPSVEIIFEKHVYDGMDFGIYLTSYLQIPHLESQKVVLDIRDTVFSQIEKIGYFEVPAVGTLKSTAENKLKFFIFSAAENALDDDFFGLEPVRFSKKAQMMLQQSDNPTFMSNQNNSEKSVNFSSVGWRTFLLIALIFTLGFFIVDQGPFVIHRSSLNEDMLQVRNLKSPRYNDELFAMKDLKTSEDENLELTGVNERDLNDGGNATADESSEEKIIDDAGDTPIPVNVDDPRTTEPKETVEEPMVNEQENTNNMRLANPTDEPRNLSILDTANKNNQRTRGGVDMPEAINYHLIAASFKTIESAQEYVEEMGGNNLDAIILLPPQGSSQTYRISIYRNRDRIKVQDFKGKLEKLGRKSGWIYKELGVK